MKQPSEVDVHELAAMPGFGKAGKIIREKVDPHWGLAGADGLREFHVVVEYTTRREDEETYTVKAASEDDAINQAKELWNEDFRSFDDDLDSVYVLKGAS